MAMIMNGPNAIINPLTGLIVHPYQWYEGTVEEPVADEPVEEAPVKKEVKQKAGA